MKNAGVTMKNTPNVTQHMTTWQHDVRWDEMEGIWWAEQERYEILSLQLVTRRCTCFKWDTGTRDIINNRKRSSRMKWKYVSSFGWCLTLFVFTRASDNNFSFSSNVKNSPTKTLLVLLHHPSYPVPSQISYIYKLTLKKWKCYHKTLFSQYDRFVVRFSTSLRGRFLLCIESTRMMSEQIMANGKKTVTFPRATLQLEAKLTKEGKAWRALKLKQWSIITLSHSCCSNYLFGTFLRAYYSAIEICHAEAWSERNENEEQRWHLGGLRCLSKVTADS